MKNYMADCWKIWCKSIGDKAFLDYKMAENVKRQFNDDASQMSVEQVEFMKRLNEELENG